MSLPPNTILTSWQPQYSDNSPGQVYTMADLGDGRIVIGGDWDILVSGDGQTTINQPYFACLDKTTWAPTNFAPTFDYDVYSFLVHGGKLYVGGFFSNVNGQARGAGCAFNLSNGTLTSWDPGVNGSINSMTINGSGDTIYIGGNFGRGSGAVQGQDRRMTCAVDLAGTLKPWTVYSNAQIAKIHWDSGLVYLMSGDGGSVAVGNNNEPAGGGTVCRADDTSGDLDPNFDITTTLSFFEEGGDFLVTSDTVWICGEFYKGQGCARNHLAAFNKSNGSLKSFDANLTDYWPYGGKSLALSTDGTTIYMGSNVSGYGDDSLTLRLLAGYNVSTGAKVWDIFPITATGQQVRSLIYDTGDKLYVGGMNLSPPDNHQYGLLIFAPSTGGGGGGGGGSSGGGGGGGGGGSPSNNVKLKKKKDNQQKNSVVGDPVILTVDLTSRTPLPTGTVTFYDGQTSLGTLSVQNGSADITLYSVSAGEHSYTATYSGDSTYSADTSDAVNHEVILPTPSIGTVESCSCDLYAGAKCVGSRFLVKSCFRPTYECSNYSQGAYLAVITSCQMVAQSRMNPARFDWKELRF